MSRYVVTRYVGGRTLTCHSGTETDCKRFIQAKAREYVDRWFLAVPAGDARERWATLHAWMKAAESVAAEVYLVTPAE